MYHHERSFRIDVKNCRKDWTYLNVVIMKDDRSLRRHMVKHLYKLGETKTWEEILGEQDLRSTIKKALSEVDCPWIYDKRCDPPCECCPDGRFLACSDSLKRLDSKYLKAVLRSLKMGCADNTCHVHYKVRQGEKSLQLHVIDTEIPALVKAKKQNRLYNVNTAYLPSSYGNLLSIQELLDKEVKTLQRYCTSICWCPEEP